MRFRTGVVCGLAVGYYFGAKAGRERYEQLRRALDALPTREMLDKAQALAALGIERLRDGGEPDNVVPLRSTTAP